MLQKLNGLVEAKGNDAEHNNAGNDHIKTENLRAVNDKIAKSPSCSKKFSDNDAHQR